jgi:ureidoglycolate dehydrogenase (NAD+)
VAARQGSLLPVAGPKGYGLAVVLDVLSGVLAGGRFGRGLGAPGSSHFIEAMQIEALAPYDEFLARMGELVDQLHGCPPAEGSGGVVLPGEPEHALRLRRLTEGIPLEATLLAELDALAEALDAPHVGRD